MHKRAKVSPTWALAELRRFLNRFYLWTSQGGHCHTPSCISLALYRNELICMQKPCLWGDEGGLDPSPVLKFDTPLISIKVNRNTIKAELRRETRGVDTKAGHVACPCPEVHSGVHKGSIRPT
jgi:hypothetical protein